MPNKDQLKGRAAVVLGTIYFMVGKLTGNLKLQAKGKGYQVVGKPLATFGDLREDVKGAMPQARGDGGPPVTARGRENTRPDSQRE